MTHIEFITSLTRRVRLVGAVAALDELRAIGSHETLAVFYVWAVDRLVTAGLDDTSILWHPLTDVRSPRSWWDDETLRSAVARKSFVPSTLARPGEPTPMVEARVLAAA